MSDHSQWSIGARVHEDLAETKRANAAEETRRINYVAKENRKDGRRRGDQRGWEKKKKKKTKKKLNWYPSLLSVIRLIVDARP